jgi:hypothetical protein
MAFDFGNLFGPPTVTGTPYGTGFNTQPAYGQTSQPSTPLATGSSAASRDAAHTLLREYAFNPDVGLSQGEIDFLTSQINASEDPNSGINIEELANQIRKAGEGAQGRRIFEGTRDDTRRRLGEIETQYRPEIERRYKAVQGLYDKGPNNQEFLNLGRVRNSAEYGAALAAGENAINQDVQMGRRQAQTAQVSRGVSSSGKLGSAVRGMETQGAEAKGRLSAGIAGDILGVRDSAFDRLRGFDTDIMNARRANELGNFDLANNLKGADYFGPRGTGMDISALRMGQERADLGMALDFIQSMMSQGQQSANTGISAISAFMPGGG